MMEDQALICVVEGLPGVGKTTLCQALAQASGALVLPEFLPETEGDREDVSYYLENERNKSARMAQSQKGWVVCDRYWQSSAVYCAASCNATSFEHLVQVKDILQPKPLFGRYVYVHLHVPESVSKARAHTPSVPNQWTSPTFSRRAAALYELAFQQAEALQPDVLAKIQVGTEHAGPDEVVARIVSFLSEVEGRR
jgi:thymidylate kinase